MHLKANNYAMQKDRLFRESKISPFSSNIVSALYKCPSVSPDQNTIMLKMWVNEQEIVLPVCGRSLCNYNDFRHQYENMLNDQLFDYRCNNDHNVTLGPILNIPPIG